MFPRVQDCVYPPCLKLLWQAGMVSRVQFLRRLPGFPELYFDFFILCPFTLEYGSVHCFIDDLISNPSFLYHITNSTISWNFSC
jgi:hypothetical protein